MTRVLIAADKFKGSLAAATVGSAITSGIRRVVGDAVEIITIPVADGGDGTVAAAVAAGFTSVPVTARLVVARAAGISAWQFISPALRSPSASSSRIQPRRASAVTPLISWTV